MCLHIFIFLSVGVEPFQATHAICQVKVSCQNDKIYLLINKQPTGPEWLPEKADTVTCMILSLRLWCISAVCMVSSIMADTMNYCNWTSWFFWLHFHLCGHNLSKMQQPDFWLEESMGIYFQNKFVSWAKCVISVGCQPQNTAAPYLPMCHHVPQQSDIQDISKKSLDCLRLPHQSRFFAVVCNYTVFEVHWSHLHIMLLTPPLSKQALQWQQRKSVCRRYVWARHNKEEKGLLQQ